MTAMQRGWEAFHAGFLISDCPYGAGTNDRNQWLVGWKRGSKGYLKPQGELKQ